jgi:hypothetical protein
MTTEHTDNLLVDVSAATVDDLSAAHFRKGT